MKDEVTEYRGYPLPHIENLLQQDVARLRQSLEQIDADVDDLRKENAQQELATNNAIGIVESAMEGIHTQLQTELQYLRQIVIGGIEIEGPASAFQGQTNLEYKVDVDGAESYDWSASGFIVQGRDDHFKIEEGNNPAPSASAYTLMIWVKPLPSAGPMDVMGKASMDFNLTIHQDGSVTHKFSCGNPVAEQLIATPASVIEFRKWNHLLLWNDGTTARIYVNGVKKAESAANKPLLPVDSNLFIGKNPRKTVADHYRGRLAHLRQYSIALGEQDLTPLLSSINPSNPAPAPDPRLRIHLPLDQFEVEQVIAPSDFDRPVTIIGNPRGAMDSLLGPVMRLDGATEITIYTQDNELKNPQSIYTLMMWVKPEASGVMPLIGAAGKNDTITLDTTAGVRLVSVKYQANETTRTEIKTAIDSITANQWQHIAICYSGTNLKIYVNGTFRMEGARTTALPFPADLIVGANRMENSDKRFSGRMAHLRLYGALLADAEIQRLMMEDLFKNTLPNASGKPVLDLKMQALLNGKLADAAALSRTITITGTPTIVSDSQLLAAMQFDGTSNVVTCERRDPADQSFKNRTIQFWIWPDNPSNTQDILGSSNTDFHVYYSYAGALTHSFKTDTGSHSLTTNSSTLPQKTWTHVTLWNDGLNSRIYFNGNKMAEISGKAPSATSANLSIGKVLGSLNYLHLKGKMALLKIYNNALTELDIRRAIYLESDSPVLSQHLLLQMPLNAFFHRKLKDESKYLRDAVLHGSPKCVDDENMGTVLEMNYDPTPESLTVTAPLGVDAATVMVNIGFPGGHTLQKSRNVALRSARAPKSEVILYSGNIISWIVPVDVFTITLEACGGQGGYGAISFTPALPGGKGARIKGTFEVWPGDELLILVGGQGEGLIRGTNPNPGAGGGGTFVAKVDVNGPYQMNVGARQKVRPLMVAGGGGGGGSGSGYGQTQAGGNGQITEAGQGNGSVMGGENGDGGNANSYQGGGAGFWGDGKVNSCTPAMSFLNGGAGGKGSSHAMNQGGFGGGGGADYLPGGGGGYSGGAAWGTWASSGAGGGGGSYNGGNNPLNEPGVHEGAGQVTLYY